MKDLESRLARIADATHFPTVPEIEQRLAQLHEASEGDTLLSVIGASRNGQRLTMISIGETAMSGARTAVVTGTPHPNEPTGALGALALADLLANDDVLLKELGLIWHIIPCVDPDGAVLNYGWYAGSFTRRHYAEHIYRPPFDEQYEWTFNHPERQPPGLTAIPESSAVAALLDRERPALLISMHNGEACGLHAYVTSQLPGLEQGIDRVSTAAGLPLYRGIPEEGAPALGRGLFQTQDMGEMVSSTGYAARHGTFGLINELPMWVNPASADESSSYHTYREVHTNTSEARADLRDRMSRWLRLVQLELSLDSPRGRAVVEQLRYLNYLTSETTLDTEVADQKCTVAFASSMVEDVTLERLRCAGHLLAYLREEKERQPLSARLESVSAAVTADLEEWAKTEQDLEFVGLGSAVRGHVGMALITAGLLP